MGSVSQRKLEPGPFSLCAVAWFAEGACRAPHFVLITEGYAAKRGIPRLGECCWSHQKSQAVSRPS